MPLLALGTLPVPTPGTKVAVSSIIPATEWVPGGAPFKGHGILLQAFANNAGAVRIYQQNVSGAYILVATLAAPTTNFIPSFSAALTSAPNSINMCDLYLDADNAGEGATVTLLVS